MPLAEHTTPLPPRRQPHPRVRPCPFVSARRYTAEERFDEADAVFDCVGEKGEERFSLSDFTAPPEGAFG